MREEQIYTGEQRLAHLCTPSERPDPKEPSFAVPNPNQFLEALRSVADMNVLLGGEDAAVHDGYNLVPEHHLVSVDPGTGPALPPPPKRCWRTWLLARRRI